MVIKMKNRPIIYKIDNMSLIPKIRGNIITIHGKNDTNFTEPMIIMEFENNPNLREFSGKINFETNLSYYLEDVKFPINISIR